MCLCVWVEAGTLVLMVSIAVSSLVLAVLIIGSLMCCIKKKRPVKRYAKHLLSSTLDLYVHEPCSQNILSIFYCSYCAFLYRCLRSMSGQSNPLFRSSSTRGSSRLGSAHISQPIFVEASATQVCKPLASSLARPHPGALKPSRAVPEVSCLVCI